MSRRTVTATRVAAGDATGPSPERVLPAWLRRELETVPAFEVFATADELAESSARIAARHPDVVRLRRIGTSGQGEQLCCLTIAPPDHFAPDALVVGLPHPNEPIGGLTALHLARRLAEDAGLRARLGHRWHIVTCIDPDGLRLNEGWLKGPFTREHYARHFYRQAGPEQIEWSFPLDYKQAWFDAVLPETFALMRLIDEHRPALLASLHNSEVGGAYYYLSRPEPDLHPVLQALPLEMGIELDRGEPEAPWMPPLDEGIFPLLDVRDTYDHLEEIGALDAFSGGNSTGAYASRHGTLTVVSELPYWTHRDALDTTPSQIGYAEALDANATELHVLSDLLTEALARIGPHVRGESPFLRASRYYASAIAEQANAMQRRGASAAARARKATVAELTSMADTVHMFRLRYGGMLLRALDAEIAGGNVRPVIRAVHRELAALHAAWCSAAAGTSEVALPLRSLVAVQYGSVLAAAEHLSSSR
ncbi:Zinc carboxypeptidase [Pseudonocardia thermophila]|uniref:Zinc carboxypeptidase n=1 Tax=Pseudonocardia thermophila TaxID=1848 RepID=A0A1M7AEB4_PSETH|nr:M14 family zinc carboxypeptidase [Pseudonocardia thermophila]SHL40879.1 Zinc carboxypeptidase [Pseudonocardia thermophila]